MNPRLLLCVLVALAATRLHAQTPGIVDASFQPALNNLKPDAILPLSDGRIYIAGSKLTGTVGGRTLRSITRLNRDGSIDPTFNISAELEIDGLADEARRIAGLGAFIFSPPNIRLVIQPDDKIAVFVVAQFGVVPKLGISLRPIPVARINPNGSRDSSFRPAGEFSIHQTLPLALRDGRWLIVDPGITNDFRRTMTLSRFTRDGAADANFATTTLTPAGSATAFRAVTGDPYAWVLTHAFDRDGRIYLAAYHSYSIYNPPFSSPSYTPGGSNPRTTVFRLNADGTPDNTFVPQTMGEVLSLRSTDQGLLCQLNTWTAGPGISFGPMGEVHGMSGGTTTVVRLRPDGSFDPTFQTPAWTTFGARFDQVTAAADGSVLALTFGQRGHRGIMRFDPSGAYDPDFAAELGEATSQITDLFPLPDGQLLAFGSFTSIGGVAQPYLARLTPHTRAGATHLGNLSVRAVAGTGAGTLAAGYITAGGNTTVLARAAGPALAQFGVVNPLADPRLTLFQGASVVAANDNWNTEPDNLIASTASRLNAFPFATGSRDAGLIAINPVGPRTVQVAGGETSPGVALLELYHAGPSPANARSPRFTNFSARSSTGNGSETLIAGFTLNGDAPRTVLIRAAGPALAKFSVPGALADPALTLYRGSSIIARNDQWQDGTADDVFLRTEATATVGTFPFDAGSRDSALVVTLPPGQYTAHVTGVGGVQGIALVEVYEVP